MIDDLIALLDELQLERVCVVSHSLGSVIALRMAIDHPDRVASLLLVSGAVSFAANSTVGGWKRDLKALSEPGSIAQDGRQPVTHPFITDWLGSRICSSAVEIPGW